MKQFSKRMTLEEFEGMYFYAEELKQIARSLGLRVGSLKKNELEQHIKAHLFGLSSPLPVDIPNRQNKGERDKLAMDSRVLNYVSDKKTKAFLQENVEKKFGVLPDKSGQWYWLNHWRKSCILAGKDINYGDLVDHLAVLKQKRERLPKIPSTRMNNFISDYLADETNSNQGRQKALEEWFKLKSTSLPKEYQAYKQAKTTGKWPR
ncbi:SAP domain-containing protein [Bartonella saheliensis]|uniref:SAP domain-containing protein n=1 Tax=Bartonella saheliensis TaxID=1457016 RepID=UPI00119FBD3E|nr:SAP domain-containing protein [Bartonella saheliensis]